jgi:hypothetical protein
MILPVTTQSHASQAARLQVLITARLWESARPVIGRMLSRRRTRVSDLRANRQVRAAEHVTRSAADLPVTVRHRHRVRFRTRGQ